MATVENVKSEIEKMIGVSGSDADVFWALSRKCSMLALAPTVAAGAKWGPGLVAMGTVALPGIGTVSGTTAAVMMMGGVWVSSYGACMSLLPGLLKFRDSLKNDPGALSAVRADVRRIVSIQRMSMRS